MFHVKHFTKKPAIPAGVGKCLLYLRRFLKMYITTAEIASAVTPVMIPMSIVWEAEYAASTAAPVSIAKALKAANTQRGNTEQSIIFSSDIYPNPSLFKLPNVKAIIV